jgi:hypothetical protein
LTKTTKGVRSSLVLFDGSFPNLGTAVSVRFCLLVDFGTGKGAVSNCVPEMEVFMPRSLTPGQLAELVAIDRAQGGIRDDVQELIRKLTARMIIDLDANPFVPDGWEVEEHKKGGQFEWNVTKINLFLSINQQGGKTIKGHKLRKELKSKAPFNANMLDFLLAHPHLIPEEWKGKCVYFWGTIYRDSDGDPCVRYLYWDDGQWDWDWGCLDDGWSSSSPAAVPAS